jgi:CheY-like chemotaxis protein
VLLHTTVERPDPVDLARVHVGRTLTKPVLPWDLREALDAVTGVSSFDPLESHPQGEPQGRTGLHILLAEDNAINARLAVRLLEKLGHSVQHVTDGQLAVEALEKGAFDAVLMDMQMPRLDGLDATRKIRAHEHGQRVPVIALTANAMKGDDRLCFDAGMDGYLTKPIDVDRLKEMLTRWVPEPQERRSG